MLECRGGVVLVARPSTRSANRPQLSAHTAVAAAAVTSQPCGEHTTSLLPARSCLRMLLLHLGGSSTAGWAPGTLPACASAQPHPDCRTGQVRQHHQTAARHHRQLVGTNTGRSIQGIRSALHAMVCWVWEPQGWHACCRSTQRLDCCLRTPHMHVRPGYTRDSRDCHGWLGGDADDVCFVLGKLDCSVRSCKPHACTCKGRAGQGTLLLLLVRVCAQFTQAASGRARGQRIPLTIALAAHLLPAVALSDLHLHPACELGVGVSNPSAKCPTALCEGPGRTPAGVCVCSNALEP